MAGSGDQHEENPPANDDIVSTANASRRAQPRHARSTVATRAQTINDLRQLMTDFVEQNNLRTAQILERLNAQEQKFGELQANLGRTPNSNHNNPAQISVRNTLSHQENDRGIDRENIQENDSPIAPREFRVNNDANNAIAKEMNEMKALLASQRAEHTLMRYQIHRATTAAPDIQRVIELTRQTPFTDRIATTVIKECGKIKFPTFEGNSDPVAHLKLFRLAAMKAHYSENEKEIGLCRHFSENLSGSALEWFSSLKPCSIDNFEQLAESFLKHFSMFIQKRTSADNLFAIVQEKNESLKDYLNRFKEVKALSANITDEVAICALKMGLWPKSSFRQELFVRPVETLDDALHQAANFIDWEETNRYEYEKKNKKDGNNENHKSNKRSIRESNDSQGRHSFAVGGSSKRERFQKFDFDPSKFCDYHQRTGHSLDDCIIVQRLKKENKWRDGMR